MTPLNSPSISSILPERNIPTPIMEDIPFNLDEETLLLKTLSCDFNSSPFRHQKVTSFKNLTIKFFQNISYLDVTNYQEKKKFSILLSETFQSLLLEKRIIKHWKKFHLKKKVKIQVTSALSYFKTMKTTILPLPLFQTFKHTFRLIGKKVKEKEKNIPLENIKKAFHEQFQFFFSSCSLNTKNFRCILNNKKEWQRIKDIFRAKIIQSHLLAIDTEQSLHSRSIQWLSGSRSSSLPIIFHFENPALFPTGILLTRSLAPLCGELDRGILYNKGINRLHLSGTDLAHAPIALQYAEKKNDFSTSEAKKQLLYTLLQIENPTERDFKKIQLIALQLLELDELVAQEKEILISTLERWLSTSEPSSLSLIKTMLTAFKTVQPLSLTPIENSFINHTFPIVWGAQTEESPTILENSLLTLNLQSERALKGPLHIGEKIQLLFTPEDKVDLVKSYISHVSGLTVHSIDTLKYLYRKNCTFNGYCVYETPS